MGKAFMGTRSSCRITVMVLAALLCGIAFTVVSGARSLQVSVVPPRSGFGGRYLSMETKATEPEKGGSEGTGSCYAERVKFGLQGAILVRVASATGDDPKVAVGELWPKELKNTAETAVFELCACTTQTAPAVLKPGSAAKGACIKSPVFSKVLREGVTFCKTQCPKAKETIERIACVAGFTFSHADVQAALGITEIAIGDALTKCLMETSDTWKKTKPSETHKLYVYYGSTAKSIPKLIQMVKMKADMKAEEKAVDKAQKALDSAKGKLVTDEKMLGSMEKAMEAEVTAGSKPGSAAVTQDPYRINKKLPGPGEAYKPTVKESELKPKWVNGVIPSEKFEDDGDDTLEYTNTVNEFEDDGDEQGHYTTTATQQSRFENDRGDEDGYTTQPWQSRFEDDGDYEQGYSSGTQGRSRFEDDGDEDDN